jgi:O-antigen ligase
MNRSVMLIVRPHHLDFIHLLQGRGWGSWFGLSYPRGDCSIVKKGAELPLVMASILLLVAVLIPYLLWRVWRTDQEPRSPLENAVTFSDWASGQDVWQSQLKGTGMLQPLAAVAFGLTALGIAYARGSNRRRSALEQMSQMNGRSFSWKSAISRTCMSQNCRNW